MIDTQKETASPGKELAVNKFDNSQIISDADTDRRAFATLKAKAAQIGQHLLKTPGGYALSRWGMVRHCASMDDVVVILSRMGARL